MLKHPLADAYWRLNRLWTKTRDWAHADNSGRNSKDLLNDEQRSELAEIGQQIHELSVTFELQSAINRANDLHRYATCGDPCPIRETWEALDRLLTQVQDDIADKWFVYVPADRMRIWQRLNGSNLIGAVKRAFGEDAAKDLEEAIHCYLAELNTACVFHAMRSAEYGLRALAWDRRVKSSTKTPIELQDWRTILTDLEKKAREIESWKKTLAREAQFAFYHGALMELRAFKNFYRNPTAHTREFWDDLQALSCLNHVSVFLRILSEKISMKARTPKRWGNAQL